MNRLVYSEDGLIRAMEMSSSRIFAFVEGGIDRVVVGEVLSKLEPGGKVYAAKELPGQVGGKPGLEAWYSALSRKSKLRWMAFDKRISATFFVDKDVDDIRRTMTKCDHIYYTKNYDIEGDLISDGPADAAIRRCLRVTEEQAVHIFGSTLSLWIKDRVEEWAEWCALCMVSAVYKIPGGCSFKRSNPIDSNSTEDDKLAFVERTLEDMSSRSARRLSNLIFMYEACYKKVRASVEADNPFRYFRGKWFKSIFATYLQACTCPVDSKMDAVFERFLDSIIGQLLEEDESKVVDNYTGFLQPHKSWLGDH